MRYSLAALLASVFLFVANAWSEDAVISRDAGVTFTLRDGDKPEKLRVVVTLDGQSPEVGWQAFLDRFFDYFDLDGNGTLTAVEAERMLPLPTIAASEPVAVRFIMLDADGDGKGTRAEWKEYVKRRGLSAVVGVWEKPTEDDVQLGKVFATALDANHDDRVDGDELVRAGRSLVQYDLNDDEFLDRKELLPDATNSPARAALEVIRDRSEAGMVLQVDLGTKPSAELELSGKGSHTAKLEQQPDGRFVVHGPTAGKIIGTSARNLANVKSAGEFLTAQLKSALGDREAIERAEIENDLALTNLLDVFAYADRNQDGRLTLKEWTDYLALIEAGLQSQICVRIADHGQNLFPMIDQDNDGRLSSLELAQLGQSLGRDSLSELPSIMRLEFSALPIRSWGGITLAARRPTPRSASASTGPQWFLSLDRNRDGIISRREFLGPPQVFQQLDKNGDGIIEIGEAGSAFGAGSRTRE